MNRVSMAPFNNLVPETRSVAALPVPLGRAHAQGHRRPDRRRDPGAFEPHGLVGLAFYDFGARSFYNTKKPIKSTGRPQGHEDPRQQSDLFVAMVKAFGANPTPMPMAKSIRRWRPASSTAPRTTGRPMKSASHYEVAKNYTLTEHR